MPDNLGYHYSSNYDRSWLLGAKEGENLSPRYFGAGYQTGDTVGGHLWDEGAQAIWGQGNSPFAGTHSATQAESALTWTGYLYKLGKVTTSDANAVKKMIEQGQQTSDDQQ